MKNLKNSIGTRLIIIGAISVILLIPSFMIQEIITDRENRRDTVTDEISSKWGGEQTITGPVLSIPYRYYFTGKEGSESIKQYVHFLPETVSISGTVEPEIRYRGIYESVLYNSRMTVSGNFSPITPVALGIPPDDFMYDEAFVSVGISDMTGIRESIPITWDNKEFVAGPGIESADVLISGVSISPGVQTGREYSFRFELNLNGSAGLLFTPVGETTSVDIRSGWDNPGFTGSFLPAERRVTPTGFRSEWNLLHLNRNFPQQWKGSKNEIENASFGVDLLLPVDEYQKTMRTVKYAIMFIALTFLTFFMIELLSSKIIHPVQYLLIGFALLVFYTLLLSISEYVVFGFAYLIASAAVVSLITVYSYVVLSDNRKTGIILLVLSLLYSYLYVLLQLQDFALLMGSIGLFMVLAFVMYLTHNIDWFDIMGNKSSVDVSTKVAV